MESKRNKATKPDDPRDRLDDLFIESVARDYLRPLQDELAREIAGYQGMDARARFVHVVKLDERQHGQGDSLPLGEALVHAGASLGQEVAFRCLVGDAPSMELVEVKQYQPRFSDRRQLKQSFALNSAPELFPDRAGASRLHEFLVDEREAYDALPAPYKAALLCLYIEGRVVARSEDVLAFVLGAAELHGQLSTATPAVNVNGKPDGWLVRIRDSKPSVEFGKNLARALRDYRPGDAEAYPEKVKHRAGDPKTETACRYVYRFEQELKRQGKCLDARKKNGVGFEVVIAKMEVDLGDAVRHYDAKTLSDVYRKWKKRNGLD